MANLTFPAVDTPYRGYIDKLRNYVREAATFVQNSPASRTAVVNTMKAFINGSNTTVVTNGATVSVKNSAGSKTVAGATIDVVAGAVEDVNLPATAALLTTAQALVVPVTGSYATTATVTVAGGVVTAIVLS